MSDERPAFALYLERMQALGFRPSRRLGQNFLLDPTLHRAIARLADLAVGDVCLEIGPGLGFLTRELVASGAAVVAVEIDRRLCELLREDLGELGVASARVRVVEADVLGPGDTLAAPVLAALEQARAVSSGPLIVVANLPYAISGTLLARLPVLMPPPERIVVLVQQDLAERLVAKAGTEAYGSLSAALGSSYAIRIERRVGREVFRPRPNVDSALVVMARVESLPFWSFPPAIRPVFLAFLRRIFGQRRKTLRALQAKKPPGSGSGASPLPPDLGGSRAEQLDVAALATLFREHGQRF